MAVTAPREQCMSGSGMYSNPHAGGSRTAPEGGVSVERDIWPRCIVWTWIPGCTHCTAGVVGHMGIGTSDGEIWEFLGGGASKGPRGGGLAFGPVLRYVQLSDKYVTRGTWDEGIQETIRKWEGTMHGVCVSNCHSFVADCLHEMRYFGFPCWRWLSYLLALWIWLGGRCPTVSRGVCACLVPVLIALSMFCMYMMFDNA
mmetsp:Transcript_34204/g.78006  ORF Transcript_34204/g.78006 Transcript_34204/m.78006 type:complete len:200 (-) Transcript_34204:25-624(-)